MSGSSAIEQFLQGWGGLWIYWSVIALMMIGLYTVISRDHLVKKVMGLNIFQASAVLFFVAMAKVAGGTAPILVTGAEETTRYSNPLPHVLMLTAIVVGIATTALALAICVRIQDAYGTLEEDELVAARLREDRADAARDPNPFEPPGEAAHLTRTAPHPGEEESTTPEEAPHD